MSNKNGNLNHIKGLKVKISELLNHIHYSGKDYDNYALLNKNCQHFAHQMLDLLL